MFSSCRVCGRPLKSRKSAEKGIGPGCERKMNLKDNTDHAAEKEKLKDQGNMSYEIKEGIVIRKCDRCGKEIRFIKRNSAKALVVNYKPVFFVPDLSGDMYVVYDGSMRRGRIVPDGIKGFTLHKC